MPTARCCCCRPRARPNLRVAGAAGIPIETDIADGPDPTRGAAPAVTSVSPLPGGDLLVRVGATERRGRRAVAAVATGAAGPGALDDRRIGGGIRRTGRAGARGGAGPGRPGPAGGVRGSRPDRPGPARPGDPAAVRGRPDAGEHHPAGRRWPGRRPDQHRGRPARRDDQGHPADDLRAGEPGAAGRPAGRHRGDGHRRCCRRWGSGPNCGPPAPCTAGCPTTSGRTAGGAAGGAVQRRPARAGARRRPSPCEVERGGRADRRRRRARHRRRRRPGNGLRNMRARAAELGGSCEVGPGRRRAGPGWSGGCRRASRICP